MYDQIKAQFEKPKALNQNRYHHVVNKAQWPKYIWNYYPLAEDYYHEFNPYFVHLCPNEELFNFFPFFTVRDGYVAFADFLLKHHKTLASYKTTFIIPKTFASLVPEQLREKFLSWELSQPRKKELRECKKVLIFGLLCDQYFGSFKDVEEKLKPLKDLPPSMKVEVCLGLRSNPLQVDHPENLNHVIVTDLVRKVLPGRDIAYLRLPDLMERSVWRDTYVLELIHGELLLSDSSLDYHLASRGASLGKLQTSTPKDSLFQVALSFEHNLHICPLPQVPSRYSELLIFKKLHPGDLMTNKNFHRLVEASL